MPRRNAFEADNADHGVAVSAQRPARRSTARATSFNDDEDDLELRELERQLNEDVDETFFQEPRKFNTLSTVLDVLGLQVMGDKALSNTELTQNPAYLRLKEQQEIVEGAIEHMAVIHCADLNGSVIQVGRVSRQFNEAVTKVRSLRKQIKDIQESLGVSAMDAATVANTAANSTKQEKRTVGAATMSLRELWMKKLECEAVLSLLEKLDIIRAAPARFDQYMAPPCRIGAAVLTLSQALVTMFADDVAQVQALHKIMEQLMLRKQRAEEVLWDTLSDVIFLRTGNGIVAELKKKKAGPFSGRESVSIQGGAANAVSSGYSVSSDSRRGRPGTSVSIAASTNTSTSFRPAATCFNPFAGAQLRYATDEAGDDDDSIDSIGSNSLFSLEENDEDDEDTIHGAQDPPGNPAIAPGSGSGGSSNIRTKVKMMIPIPVVDAEMDLVADESRCLEEMTLSGMGMNQTSKRGRHRNLPRYADPVLALRILVECLALLRRLDDVERIISESLEREIRHIVQREQSRTFARLQRRQPHKNMSEFRRHLSCLLSAFGCIMLRLSHLTEILRCRISGDRELMQSIQSPATIMRAVLTAANDIMQREIKQFLKACLHRSESSVNDPMGSSINKSKRAHEAGLFSLGITDSDGKHDAPKTTRTNVMDMTVTKFVNSILFPKTKSQPEVRHALHFRRSVSRWTLLMENAKKELSLVTGEDTSSPSYNNPNEVPAIVFLDKVIQDELLPVLQEEAVNGTTVALERRDAFDPVLDRTLYARPGSNEPQDVEMCLACRGTYESTGPLFIALHRLPPDGSMYTPLVAVLEHVMLTFISRVKQQVTSICSKKTALLLLTQDESERSLVKTIERRRPYNMMIRAYASADATATTPATPSASSGLTPLSPPLTDTSPRHTSLKGVNPMEELAEGLEVEELVLEQELDVLHSYLQFDEDSTHIAVCTDEELMRAACLAHSLLKLATLLENRLKVRSIGGFERFLPSTRALREAIKSVRAHGVTMAKFCRLDMLMQSIVRLSKVCSSSTLVTRDAVRIPSSVNDLGDYLTNSSESLREACGHAVTAYIFSSLEQYIPLCLMATVRSIAGGKGIIRRSPLTMNGIEALDRSGSVLYRDLKGATSFENSFWDVELAAEYFERSASFISILELEMEELVTFFVSNPHDFTEEDYELMFSMTGPRRRGDVGRYHMAKRQLEKMPL